MLLGSAKPVPRNAWLALAAITVLGAALRLYGLSKDSFWLDELIRVTQARMENFDKLRDFLRGDVHPPGYVMLLHAINRWIGQAEWHFRLPSAFAGIAVIPIAFTLGQRLYSHREGLAAALLTAILWCPINYSQEAAPYMILVALTAGATCLWLPLLDELRATGRVRWGLALGYAICATLAYYTHFFGIMFFGLQSAASFVLCLKRPRAWGWLFGMYLLSIAGFGWWLPDFLTQLASPHATAAWMKPPSNSAFFRFIRYLFNREHAFMWVVFAFWLALLAGTVRSARNSTAAQDTHPKIQLLASPGCLLFLWLAIPFALIFTVSRLGKPMLQERYLLISMLPAYLLLARALIRVPEFCKLAPARQAALQNVLTALLSLSMLGHLFWSKAYYSAPQRTQFREAIEFAVRESPGRGQTAMFGYLGGAGLDYTDYYFARFHSPDLLRQQAGRLEDLPAIEELLVQPNTHRVVFFNAHADADTAFVEALKQRLVLLEHRAFAGAHVWIFENRRPE